MATHSSTLAWRIPGMGKPGGLLSMGSHSQTRLKQLSSSSSRPACRWFLPRLLAEGLNSSPGGPRYSAAGASSRHGSWLSPEQEVWGRARKNPYAFYDPVLEVTHCYFCHIPLEGSHWVQLTFKVREIHFHLFKGRALKNLWMYF